MEIWLQDHKFKLHSIPEDGSCSASVIWDAFALQLIPNYAKFENTFKTLEDFIVAAAEVLLSVELENAVYQQLRDTSLVGLQQLWRQLPDSSLLDTSAGLVECGVKIHHIDEDLSVKQVKCSTTIVKGPIDDVFEINVLHYKCPEEHFALLLPDDFQPPAETV